MEDDAYRRPGAPFWPDPDCGASASASTAPVSSRSPGSAAPSASRLAGPSLVIAACRMRSLISLPADDGGRPVRRQQERRGPAVRLTAGPADQPGPAQAVHERGDRARRQPEQAGQLAGPGARVVGQAGQQLQLRHRQPPRQRPFAPGGSRGAPHRAPQPRDHVGDLQPERIGVGGGWPGRDRVSRRHRTGPSRAAGARRRASGRMAAAITPRPRPRPRAPRGPASACAAGRPRPASGAGPASPARYRASCRFPWPY